VSFEPLPFSPDPSPRSKTNQSTYIEIPDSINVTPHNHFLAFLRYATFTIGGVLALFWILTSGVAYLIPYLPPESDQWMAPLGEAYIKDLKKKHEVVNCPDYTRMLEELSPHMTNPPAVEMEVFQGLGPTLNAYALPGGKIVLYEALMRELKEADARRFVLAHEMGHVYHRHSLQAVGKLFIVWGLITPATVVFPQARNLLEGLLNVSSMQYSQEKELEADRYAIELLTQAGHNPRAGIEVFETLKKATEGNPTPDFLRTHPPDETRIAQIKALTAEKHK
jgi:predicted Zn-dependent protease